MRDIHLVNESFANVYLIIHRDIDAGTSGNEHRVLKYMSSLGLNKEPLNLIIITHAHYDHIGTLASLKRLTNAKIAAHKQNLKSRCFLNSVLNYLLLTVAFNSPS